MKTVLVLVLAFFLAGCPSVMPRAPQGPLEQIEATELSLQAMGESIVNLTCTKYVNKQCVEPGKAFNATQGETLHKQVRDARAALKIAKGITGGQIGECLGAKRTQAACISAVKALMLEVERKVLEAQAQGAKS